MLNSKAVFNLYRTDANAKKVLDYMTLHGKDQEKFFVEALVKDLRLPRAEILTVFKSLQDPCKMGSWLRGRVNPGQTRFETIYKMSEVEKAMHDPKHDAGMPYRSSPKKAKPTPKKKRMVQVPEVKEVVSPAEELKATVTPIRKPSNPTLHMAPQHNEQAGSPIVNTLFIRPGFVLQIPVDLSEAERQKVANFIELAN